MTFQRSNYVVLAATALFASAAAAAEATAPIERFQIHDNLNAQALTPALARRERVRTAQLAVASLEKINKIDLAQSRLRCST
jgi:hypothetical protein